MDYQTVHPIRSESRETVAAFTSSPIFFYYIFLWKLLKSCLVKKYSFSFKLEPESKGGGRQR